MPVGSDPPEKISKWFFGIICLCIYAPLCWIRKVEKLAVTHLFGDIMIIFTIIVIVGFSAYSIGQNGVKTDG